MIGTPAKHIQQISRLPTLFLKKTNHFIFVHNPHVSRSIFYNFYTFVNRNEYSVKKNLNVSAHYLVKLKRHKKQPTTSAYTDVPVKDVSSARRVLRDCISDNANSSRRLQLNASKSELIWLGSRFSLKQLTENDLTLELLWTHPSCQRCTRPRCNAWLWTVNEAACYKGG